MTTPRPAWWPSRDSTKSRPAVPVVTSPPDLVAEAPGPRRFRPDIQGLRAIAVTLVVFYHAGVPLVTGGYVGVDVFFVISGFLITGQLLREIEGTGRVRFWRFYAGRMRRLIPPAALVMVLTAVLARIYGPAMQFRTTATHVIYSAGYLINYRLAHERVNYQNADRAVSPLEHFWSLAVEEQFYLLWPLIMMCCVWAYRKRAHATITGALAVVAAVSLYLSVTITRADAPLAYFSLHTRAWELAGGAGVAMIAERLSRQPAWTARVASWLGVGLIVAGALVYDDNTAFPGTAALLPVGGAVLAVAGGCRPARGSAEYLLDRRPFQGLGAVSYSWYLWHWPAIALAPYLLGRTLTWPQNLELMAVMLAVAVLSYRLIESPFRRTELRRVRWTGLGLGLSGSAAAVAAVLIVTAPSLVGSGAAAITVSLDQGGDDAIQLAVAQASQTTQVPSNLTPTLDQAATDQPAASYNGCHLDYTATQIPDDCRYGDPTGTETAVLVGDSHAEQWLPGLDQAARDEHAQLYNWTKAACPFADLSVYSPVLKRDFTECDTFRQEVIAKIQALHPSVVIISQSNSVPGAAVTNAGWADDTARSVAELQAAGIPVVYIGDTPYRSGDLPECLAEHLNDVGACAKERDADEPYPGRSAQLQQTLTAAHVTYLDPADWFCTADDCPAVVGNLLVDRDDSHVTTAYSAYLAPLLRPVFTQVQAS